MFSKVNPATESQSMFESRLEKSLADLEGGRVVFSREATLFAKIILWGFLYLGELLKGRG